MSESATKSAMKLGPRRQSAPAGPSIGVRYSEHVHALPDAAADVALRLIIVVPGSVDHDERA